MPSVSTVKIALSGWKFRRGPELQQTVQLEICVQKLSRMPLNRPGSTVLVEGHELGPTGGHAASAGLGYLATRALALSELTVESLEMLGTLEPPASPQMRQT